MSREEIIFKAKVFEQIERYDDMIQVIKQLIALGHQLSAQERNLLSIAYKSGIASVRTASRSLKTIERREQTKNPDSTNLYLIRDYKNKTEAEIIKYGNDIIQLIDKTILPTIKNDEQSIFFFKLKADYYRYLTECTSGQSHKKYSGFAGDAYKDAYEKAQTNLKTTDPTRLGLALNYSVYYYEVLLNIPKSIEIAKGAFDEAILSIDQIEEEHYKESTTILQLLRDNMAVWTSEIEEAA